MVRAGRRQQTEQAAKDAAEKPPSETPETREPPEQAGPGARQPSEMAETTFTVDRQVVNDAETWDEAHRVDAEW